MNVTNSQLDTANKSQEVSPFPAGVHKAHINRRAQRHNKHKTEKNIKDLQKKYRLGTVSKVFYWRDLTGFTSPTSPLNQMWIKTHEVLRSTYVPARTRNNWVRGPCDQYAFCFLVLVLVDQDKFRNLSFHN